MTGQLRLPTKLLLLTNPRCSSFKRRRDARALTRNLVQVEEPPSVCSPWWVRGVMMWFQLLRGAGCMTTSNTLHNRETKPATHTCWIWKRKVQSWWNWQAHTLIKSLPTTKTHHNTKIEKGKKRKKSNLPRTHKNIHEKNWFSIEKKSNVTPLVFITVVCKYPSRTKRGRERERVTPNKAASIKNS